MESEERKGKLFGKEELNCQLPKVQLFVSCKNRTRIRVHAMGVDRMVCVCACVCLGKCFVGMRWR